MTLPALPPASLGRLREESVLPAGAHHTYAHSFRALWPLRAHSVALPASRFGDSPLEPGSPLLVARWQHNPRASRVTLYPSL